MSEGDWMAALGGVLVAGVVSLVVIGLVVLVVALV